MSELDWSTSRKRKDFDGVERIAVPLGEGLIVSLLVRHKRQSRGNVLWWIRRFDQFEQRRGKFQ